MKKYEATVVYPSKCELGEGSLWDDKNQKLLWIDIMDCKIYCYDPKTTSNLGFSTNKPIGTVVISENGLWVFADEDGLATLDPTSGTINYGVQPIKDYPEIRFNDGKCNPRGELWAGTMAYNCSEGAGNLYSFSGLDKMTVKIPNVSISNGLVWNKSKTKFYFIDSLTYQVSCYDYDNKTGVITNKTIVTTIDQKIGLPDGMTIDNQDHLWIALFYGGKVIRICPDTGKQVFEVHLPVPNVTSCAFGGPNLNELYITTARHTMDESALKKYPLAGSLFKIKLPYKGVVSNKMKI